MNVFNQTVQRCRKYAERLLSKCVIVGGGSKYTGREFVVIAVVRPAFKRFDQSFVKQIRRACRTSDRFREPQRLGSRGYSVIVKSDQTSNNQPRDSSVKFAKGR